MTRPIYQTPAHLVAQREIIAQYSRARRMIAVEMPDLSRYDYEMHDGKAVREIVEVKDRPKIRFRSIKESGYGISHRKLSDLRNAARSRPVGAVLLVRMSDGLYVAPIPSGGKWRTAMGGRKDRNDPQDIEMMEFVPQSQFRKIDP
jgi:hypothetical protein